MRPLDLARAVVGIDIPGITFILADRLKATPGYIPNTREVQDTLRVAYVSEDGVHLSNVSAQDRDFIRTELQSLPVQTKDDGQSIRLSSPLYSDLRRLENEVDTLVPVQQTYLHNPEAQAKDLIRKARLGKNQEDVMVLLAEVD